MQGEHKVPQDIIDGYLAGEYGLGQAIAKAIVRNNIEWLEYRLRQIVGLPALSASNTADMRDAMRRLAHA
jgi:hypothetical protein